MEEITLPQMLAARERRAARQAALLRRCGLPLICFTMNIAGPVKTGPLICRAFAEGCRLLAAALSGARLKPVFSETLLLPTGCEAYYAVDCDPIRLKALCTGVEETSALGRFYDMDVLNRDGTALHRSPEQELFRGCIVCGAPGRLCAARRTHPANVLQQVTRQKMEEALWARDRDEAAAIALRALLDEACVTPKPGLVDRSNNGSHRDMDIFTFTASASALAPHLSRFVAIGRQTADLPPEQALAALRLEGRKAELAMFSAAGGVNTHKGAIFLLGAVCGAVGRLWTPETPCRDPEALLRVCGELTRSAAETDFAAVRASGMGETAGQRLYLRYGITGVRGEAAAGLPSVRTVGLPAFRRALQAGRSRNDAGAIALVYLLSQAEDSNLAARGGPEGAQAAAGLARALLARSPLPEPEEIAGLDRELIRRRLSPGGCADLLAVTLFLYDWFQARLPGEPEESEWERQEAASGGFAAEGGEADGDAGESAG